MTATEHEHITVRRAGFPWILRALYIVLVGSWLTLARINLDWSAGATVIGLPLGLWMLNRVPQVLTLRPLAVEPHMCGKGGRVHIRTTSIRQQPWPV